jgi:hypothetical protein
LFSESNWSPDRIWAQERKHSQKHL